VSTTHVSCGAIFGIGVVERNAHWKTITAVLATWLTTLPLAALVGAALYRLLANGATAPA
jgi:PiT family inorganic phosphate transporter